MAKYRIRVIAAPLLNWAPGNVKSLVFGVFLEYTPTFCLKSPLFGGFFELTPTQKPILKNRTPGLQWRGYGIFFILTAMLIIRTHLIFQKNLSLKISQISLQITLKWIKNSENQNFCQLWNYGIIQIKVEKFLFIFLAEWNFGYNRYTIYWGIFVYFENSKSHIDYFMLLTEQSSVGY